MLLLAMDSEDELLLALSFFRQGQEQVSHMLNLATQSQTLASQASQNRFLSQVDNDSSDEDVRGRGNTADGGPKAPYLRRFKRHRYKNIRYDDPDEGLFDSLVHLAREEFDELFQLTKNELIKPMNVRQEMGDCNELRAPRKRRLEAEELLFLFLEILGGANEGGQGVVSLAHDYDVSPGTVSNYFKHALFSVFRSLENKQPRIIRWPSYEERAAMHGLIIGFPKCVFFVDGNKNKRWQPIDPGTQARAYDGYKKLMHFP